MSFDVASAGAAATRSAVILPGATLGLLGGGQLGRMFTVAARTLGYRVTVLDPDPLSPAAEFATGHLNTPYSDPASLEELARTCAAVTTEFENAPADALDAIATRTVVRPRGSSVAVAQDRRREKQFFVKGGFPLGAAALEHVGGHGPGGAGEPDQRAFGLQLGPYQLQRLTDGRKSFR